MGHTLGGGTRSSAHYVEAQIQNVDRNGRSLMAQNFYAEVRVCGPQQAASHSGI